MKLCLFCDNVADTLEHVIPQWVHRCVSPTTHGSFPVVVGRYTETDGYLDQRNQVSLAFKARIVCAQCNNGWMAQLEAEVSELLKPLMACAFPVLFEEFFNHLRQQSKLVAVWMIKTALTTSYALPGKQRLPQTFRQDVRLLQPPSGAWVDIAKARTQTIGVAFTKNFPVANGNLPVTIQRSGDSFQFCLQVNHLLLRVAMVPQAVAGYVEKEPFRLYPHADIVIPSNLEFDDIDRFLHSVILRTWNGCRGEG